MDPARCFIDLDYCMYDTDAMVIPILSDLDRLTGSPAAVRNALKALNDHGYSFERHLELLGQPPEVVAVKAREYLERLAQGDSFLYPDVADGLRELSMIAACNLLTFGYQPYQQSKVAGIPSLVKHLREAHFVWKERTKGDVLRAQGDRGGLIYFLDDSPPHLEDAKAKAPWVRIVRMLRKGVATPHAGDGQAWPVVTSFPEFVNMVRDAQR